MNRTQIFKSLEFGAIRIISNEQGEPFFCAKDVALALGYGDALRAAHRYVDQADFLVHEAIDTLGRKNYISFVNKAGLYALIFSSKKAQARRFKHWMTRVVLPAIPVKDTTWCYVVNH